MLQTLDEVKNVELSVHGVINGIDHPNLLSVDSTTPIVTEVDEVDPDDETEKVEAGATKSENKVEKMEESNDKTTPQKKEETPTTNEKLAVQKRIDELTKKRRVAERERDYIKTTSDARIAELEEELEKLRSKVPVEGKPHRDDFAEDEDYLEALADWKVDQKLRDAQAKAQRTETDSKSKEAINQVYDGLDEVMNRGREKYDDFNDLVLNEDLVLSESLTEIILESDVADDLLYYLGKNPNKAEELSGMSSLKAAKEIGKLENIVVEELSKVDEEDYTPPPAKVDPPPKKKISNAPPPIDPVKTTGAVDKDPSQMSSKEYRAWRERNKG